MWAIHFFKMIFLKNFCFYSKNHIRHTCHACPPLAQTRLLFAFLMLAFHLEGFSIPDRKIGHLSRLWKVHTILRSIRGIFYDRDRTMVFKDRLVSWKSEPFPLFSMEVRFSRLFLEFFSVWIKFDSVVKVLDLE